jgi:hypothetical protein
MLGDPLGLWGEHIEINKNSTPLVPTLPRRKKLGLLCAWCSSSLVEQNLYIISYIIYIFYIIQYYNWVTFEKIIISLFFCMQFEKKMEVTSQDSYILGFNIIKSPSCIVIHWGLFNGTKMTSPSLDDTFRNVTHWFFWIHWSLKNHKKHLNKYFDNIFNEYIY